MGGEGRALFYSDDGNRFQFGAQFGHDTVLDLDFEFDTLTFFAGAIDGFNHVVSSLAEFSGCHSDRTVRWLCFRLMVKRGPYEAASRCRIGGCVDNARRHATDWQNNQPL